MMCVHLAGKYKGHVLMRVFYQTVVIFVLDLQAAGREEQEEDEEAPH